MPRELKLKNVISLKLTDDQLAELRHYAYEEQDVSISDVIRELLDAKLAENRQAQSVV